jgi:uncharacterized SAM-binding protein YcdF (DUF218 family)
MPPKPEWKTRAQFPWQNDKDKERRSWISPIPQYDETAARGAPLAIINNEKIVRTVKLLLATLLALALLVVAGAAFAYATTPLSNTRRPIFDVIIVLGYPTNPDGSPSPVERARVTEGVREYRRGKAPALIMTGGAAHNDHIEADAMADLAIARGVPAGAVLREEKARNTIQNAWYSLRLMQARHWKSAEIVSSQSHLPRASLVFARFPIEYAMHGAPNPPEAGWLYNGGAFVYEARNTARIRLFGFTASPYLP